MSFRWMFAALVGALVLTSHSCSSPGREWNVIILSVDTLSRSAVRAFDPQAPEFDNLDRFSRRATPFTNATSPSSWTLPAHASLMTGIYPDRRAAPGVYILDLHLSVW